MPDPQYDSWNRRRPAGGIGVPGAGSASAAPAASETQLDLNTASVAQLTELPGIGPALASRIVEYREKAGPFESVTELMNVRGIGEKSFAKLEPRVRVSSASAKDADKR